MLVQHGINYTEPDITVFGNDWPMLIRTSANRLTAMITGLISNERAYRFTVVLRILPSLAYSPDANPPLDHWSACQHLHPYY